MKNKHMIFVIMLWGLVASCLSLGAAAPLSGRSYVELDLDWRFSKGDFARAMMPAFNDTSWQRVNVPHDWSSEGPFSAELGSGNGYAPGGIGWYRKHFKLDASATNKLVTVEFDGVYANSEVWINGHFVGGRPYGYSSFQCVLTPLVRFGEFDNILAVRVDHSRIGDSRWYTGSGIYRHARLRITDKLRIGHWGTYVTTPEVANESATVQVETAVENDSGQSQSFSLQAELIAPDGRSVAVLATEGTLADRTNQIVVQRLKIASPKLWSVDSPVLYTLKSRLSKGGVLTDETTTAVGIRTLRFDPDKGFFLNGVAMKFKGVCIHHDAGCLGAAVPEKVLERRLRLLKELGVNAIRCSHNPPSPELLDICDRIGLLVKDEAFDEFAPGKHKWMEGWTVGAPSHFGYSEFFDRWSVIDAQDMVRRDRNHPCVILWSIGNEIDSRNDPYSDPVLGKDYQPANPPAQQMADYARTLIAAVKALDRTRPVTMALALAPMSDAVGLGEMLDVVGYNYQESRYAADHQKYPKRFLFDSENGHGYAQWQAARTNEFIGGQFLWTGIDFLGEAGRWPSRGSGAGLLDLCGFKKPNAWFRQSLWSDKPMVYLSASAGGGGRYRGGQESWNWGSNTMVTVRCYTTCPEVALSLNDKSIGTKRLADAVQGALVWEVPFEPGTIKAAGIKDGVVICDFSLRTAGAARRIILTPDATELRADGKAIGHIEFQIVDEHGVRVPAASHEVTFAIDGPAVLLGIENGDLSSPSNGKGPSRNANRGRGLAILQAGAIAGEITVTATSPGLDSMAVKITIKPRDD